MLQQFLTVHLIWLTQFYNISIFRRQSVQVNLEIKFVILVCCQLCCSYRVSVKLSEQYVRMDCCFEFILVFVNPPLHHHHHHLTSMLALSRLTLAFTQTLLERFSKIFFTFTKTGTRCGSAGQSIILSARITAFWRVIKAKNVLKVFSHCVCVVRIKVLCL